MTDRRTPGSGNVETLPSGRFRARVRVPGRPRYYSRPFETREEAERHLAAVLAELAAANLAPTGSVTLRAYGGPWLDAREVSGEHRAIKTERSLWLTHVCAAEFIDWPLADVDRRAGKRWLEKLSRTKALAPRRGKGGTTTHAKTTRFVSWQTRRQALILARQVLDCAVEDEIIAANPFADLTVTKPAGADEEWTFLDLEEIALVTDGESIPEAERVAFTVAIYSGMRQGEMLGLLWPDVHLEGDRPHVVVRFSHRGRTKNGRTRIVPLLGPARVALERWKRACPRSDEGLVFPTPRGCRRQRGDDFGWADTHVPQREIARLRAKGLSPAAIRPGWRSRAGINRHVRFHDLRHTCASHLVMGSWGAKWSLSEIASMLGHRDTSVTERYAHLGEDHLHRLASVTARGPQSGVALGLTGTEVVADSSLESLARPRRLELLTLRSVVPGRPEDGREVNPQSGPVVAQSTRLAEALLEIAAAEGASVPGALVDALVESVLGADLVRLALAVRDAEPEHRLRRAIELAGAVWRAATEVPVRAAEVGDA